MKTKKIAALFLSLCMSFSLVGFAGNSSTSDFEESYLSTGNKELLSSMSEEECMEWLAENGITIPEEFANVDIQAAIAGLEQDPYSFMAVSSRAHDFFGEISDAICNYYGWPDAMARYVGTVGYDDELEDSEVYSWNSSMVNYNCYAYVLGRYSTCHPGNFSGQVFDGEDSIDQIADMVKDDLQG